MPYDPTLVEAVITRLSVYGLRTPFGEIAEGVLAAIDATGDWWLAPSRPTDEMIVAAEDMAWVRDIYDAMRDACLAERQESLDD